MALTSVYKRSIISESQESEVRVDNLENHRRGGLDLISSNGTHQQILKFISNFILMSQVASQTVKNGRPMEKKPAARTSNS